MSDGSTGSMTILPSARDCLIDRSLKTIAEKSPHSTKIVAPIVTGATLILKGNVPVRNLE